MADIIVPYRQLGAAGLNTDVNPLALPPTMWTRAENLRFKDLSIQRGPRFRMLGTTRHALPCFVAGYPVPNGTYDYVIGYQDGAVHRWQARGESGEPGIETILTPQYQEPSIYQEPFTAATVQGVVYVNRPDHPLAAMPVGGERLKYVEEWNPDWRCKAVRSINGQVIAIGVSRNGRYYPTMIKVSDFAAYGSSRQEWIATTKNSADENILGNLGERLIDGAPLQNRLYLYSEHEVYAMTPQPDNSIFSYRPVFSDRGVISQNCVVNVANTHFVFGPDYLWAHDGQSSKPPLSNGRIDKAIYPHLVRQQRHQFFTVHIPERQEIAFCFVSTHPNCKFRVGRGNVPEGLPDYPGCNRAVVYDYRNDTFVVDDLPYLVGAAIVSPYGGKRWEEMTTTWETETGTWNDYADKTPPLPLYVAVLPGGDTDPIEEPEPNPDPDPDPNPDPDPLPTIQAVDNTFTFIRVVPAEEPEPDPAPVPTMLARGLASNVVNLNDAGHDFQATAVGDLAVAIHFDSLGAYTGDNSGMVPNAGWTTVLRVPDPNGRNAISIAYRFAESADEVWGYVGNPDPSNHFYPPYPHSVGQVSILTWWVLQGVEPGGFDDAITALTTRIGTLDTDFVSPDVPVSEPNSLALIAAIRRPYINDVFDLDAAYKVPERYSAREDPSANRDYFLTSIDLEDEDQSVQPNLRLSAIEDGQYAYAVLALKGATTTGD